MFLYLVRHAEASSELADPSQALTENGLRNLKKVASHLSELKIPLNIIFHSNKLRAKQTAAVIADYLKPADGISEADRLGPLDDPSEWERRLKNSSKNIMLVGHLPYMAKLFSLLVCGFTDDGAITFGNSTVVCLKRENNGSWMLQWMIGPDVVGGLNET